MVTATTSTTTTTSAPTTTTPAPPTCIDGVKNGDETDVDCGGSACPPCAVGKTCSIDQDCANPPLATGVCLDSSICGFECETGFGNCDGDASTGCETDLTSNPQHCSSCNVICSVVNGQAGCVNSNCTIMSCNTGWSNCDGNFLTGCEINVDNDINNCGTCGNVCSGANGTPDCFDGQCKMIACDFGFGDCDNNASNGCETDLLDNDDNCGSCGRQCEAPATCQAGNCTI